MMSIKVARESDHEVQALGGEWKCDPTLSPSFVTSLQTEGKYHCWDFIAVNPRAQLRVGRSVKRKSVSIIEKAEGDSMILWFAVHLVLVCGDQR